MIAKSSRKNRQCRDAVIFILVASLVLGGVKITAGCPRQNALQVDPTSAISQKNDHTDVPDRVVKEADRLAWKEWAYVSRAFPERSYSESRLESIYYVQSCHDIEKESIEVYGISCSYRRDSCADWEQAENAAGSYLVFRGSPDGPVEWLGDMSTYCKPGTEEFEDALHEVLMEADHQYIFKLLADKSLEKALGGTLQEYLLHLIPGDSCYFGWKPLAQEMKADGGQVCGVLLFHTSSGSPMIYSEETGRYVSAIYSTCLLPVCVSYQKDGSNRYVVTDLWKPTEESYEADIREHFPAEAAALVLENLDQFTADLLKENEVSEDESVLRFFPGGPVWPEYVFDAALNDASLCGLAGYYPEGDIYCAPVREEVIRRFRSDPAALLNGLGLCHPDAQNTVCSLIAQGDIHAGGDPEIEMHLTDEGAAAYERLKLLVQEKAY